MKIFINDAIHPAGFLKLKYLGIEVISDFDRIGEADGMIVRGVVADRKLLSSAKNLKVVGKHGAGYNTIDLEAAKELGIRVVYAPGANAEGVAELIVSLMLDVSRRVTAVNMSICDGSYEDKNKFTGFELYGKKAAFWGFGNVSRKAAAILINGFGMQVSACDNYLPQSVFDYNGVQCFTDLDEMLAAADYVAICVPYTPDTKNSFDAKRLSHMKNSAVLINTSRGGIVNENDLFAALTAGQIAGAGFDVFETEPPSNKNPLFGLPNFVGTPHIGGNTAESVFRVTDLVIDQVMDVLEGREPDFEVKLS